MRQFRPIEPVTTRDAGDRFRENITTSFLCHPNPIVRSLLYRAIHFRPTSNKGYPQEIENPPLPLYLVKLFAPNLLRYISRNYTNYFQMYFNAIQIFHPHFDHIFQQLLLTNDFPSLPRYKYAHQFACVSPMAFALLFLSFSRAVRSIHGQLEGG